MEPAVQRALLKSHPDEIRRWGGEHTGCCGKQPPALRGLGQDGRRGGQDGVPRVGEESGRERCKGPCSHFSTCSVMVEAGLGAWGSPGEEGMGREGEERSGGAL